MDATGDVRGHAADMAKRVESAGEADRVVFTDRVRAMLPPRLIQWEELRTEQLKGDDQPSALYRLVGLADETRQAFRNPFVVGGPIQNPRDFFGRARAVRFSITRLGSPTATPPATQSGRREPRRCLHGAPGSRAPSRQLPFTPDEIRPLLTRPIPEFDLAYAPDAVEAIITATHCQPFLTQAVAFELVQYMNEPGGKEATGAAVEEAIRRALDTGGEYFADVWSDAGPDGQAILLAVTGGETPPDCPHAHRWLIDHDVLGDGGSFLVPMMERWVREQIVSARKSSGFRR